MRRIVILIAMILALTMGVGSVAYALWIGTNGDDRKSGDNGANTLIGRGGDDVLKGLGGADELSGNKGNDDLFGGDGPDVIDGGSGNDLLVGGNGSDDLKGASGNDNIYTGTKTSPGDPQERDDVRCGPGEDTVVLGPGDRAIHNLENKDVCENKLNYNQL